MTKFPYRFPQRFAYFPGGPSLLTSTTIVTLNITKGIDFECHFEEGELVIDRCVGASLGDVLNLFPAWALEAALESKQKEKRDSQCPNS